MEKNLTPSKRKISEGSYDLMENDGIKKNRENNFKSPNFSFTEIKGDLFLSSEYTSLAHCISQDINMGKGIAVAFKNKFGGIQELKLQSCKPGDVAVLKRGKRFIYYLVTKNKYWEKPTYFLLQSSLLCLKNHALENNVSKLAMPQIGCGLDGLSWNIVKKIIMEVFQDTDLKICIYSL